MVDPGFDTYTIVAPFAWILCFLLLGLAIVLLTFPCQVFPDDLDCEGGQNVIDKFINDGGGGHVPDAEPVKRFCGWIRDDCDLKGGWQYLATHDDWHELDHVLRATISDGDYRGGRNLTYTITTGEYPGGDREAETIPCHWCRGGGQRDGVRCNNCRGKGHVPFL